MIIIGITGQSGAGKSRVAAELIAHYGEEDAAVLPMDNYYKGILPTQTLAEYNRTDFNAPDAIRFDLLKQHIAALQQGKTIFLPSYDKATGISRDAVVEFKPVKILVLEGVLIYEPGITEFVKHTVFVRTNSAEGLIRRVYRDQQAHGRSFTETFDFFQRNSVVAYNAHIKPCKKFIDIVIDNNRPISADTIKPIIAVVSQGKKRKGVLFLLEGCFGVGKTTVLNRILEKYRQGFLQKAITCTTRAMRPGEQEGREYHFLSKEEFEQREKDGKFVVTIDLAGNRYASTADFVEKLHAGTHMLMDVHPDVAALLKKTLGDGVKIVTIFMSPPNADLLAERMRQRGDSVDVVKRRVALNEEYLKRAPEANYQVVNMDVDVTVEMIADIMSREVMPNLYVPVNVGRAANFYPGSTSQLRTLNNAATLAKITTPVASPSNP